MRKGAVFGALLLGALGAATLAWRPAPPPATAQPALPSPTELVAFEAVAADACRCERASPEGGKAACWAALDRQVARYRAVEEVSLCGRFSPVRLCFQGEGREVCMVREYGGGACTAEEARTLDAIYVGAMRPGDSSLEWSERAADAAVQALVRGEHVEPPSGSSGAGCEG